MGSRPALGEGENQSGKYGRCDMTIDANLLVGIYTGIAIGVVIGAAISLSFAWSVWGRPHQ